MIVLIITTAVLMFVSIITAVAFMCRWTYLDAKSRGLDAGLWTVCVLIGQNLTGLIVYLLAGRKGTAPSVEVKAKKYVVSAVISLAVFIISCVGLVASLVFYEGGFEYSMNSYQVSWGNKWEYSFGFSNETKTKTIYVENGGLSKLFIEGNCNEGSAVLVVSDNEQTQTFDFASERSSREVELPDSGRVKLILIMNDARNGDFDFRWE